MNAIITEPLFYAVAIPSVILLGLSKGGFAGLGIASTPMLALYLPPLEAAAGTRFARHPEARCARMSG